MYNRHITNQNANQSPQFHYDEPYPDDVCI